MDRTSAANYGTDANGHRIRVPKNSSTGTPGTSISSQYENDLQEELIGGIIEAAGLTPTAGEQRQVIAALQLLFAALKGSSKQDFWVKGLHLSDVGGSGTSGDAVIYTDAAADTIVLQTGVGGALKANTVQNDGRFTVGSNATGTMDALPLGQGDGRYGKLSNVISGGSINGGTGTTLSTSVSMTPTVDTTLIVVANCGAGSAQTITNVALSVTGGTLQNEAVNWSNGSTLGNAFGIVKIAANTACTITVSVTANASTTLTPQLIYLGVPSA